MDILGKNMQSMRLEKKRKLSKLYSKLIFPRQGQNWMDVKWTIHQGVTFVTMWDEEHLIKNIQSAMIQEMMGLGPMKYCIVYNEMPNFFKRLLLLINYLPQKKMCFYPPQFILEAPFDCSPWREIGKAIGSRPFFLKNHLFRVICFTKQFVIFQKIGVYGPTYFL